MLNRGSTRWLPALAALAVVALAASPAAAEEATPTDSASAEPGPTNTIGPQTDGSPVCTVKDDDLDHLTGMVWTSAGIVGVEGGVDANRVETWLINPTSCEATVTGRGADPKDIQDIAVGTDGSLWIVDNVDETSTWLTFYRIDAAGGNAAVYRASKPAGVTVNAKALIMDADNLPIVLSASNASAVLYKVSAPMQQDARDDLPPLTNVGEIPLVQTDTPSPRGLFDQRFVSGASISSDRTKIVVRTKSDAYEFVVGADGDIVTALTTGTPVITPLPMEEDGQAITYNADATKFLTLSSVDQPVLRGYSPYVPPVATTAPAPAGGGGGGLDFGDITTIATVTGVLGLLAVIAGIVGIVRFRRGLHDGEPYDDDLRPPRPRRRPSDDGTRRAPARVGPGEEYGRDGYGPRAGQGPGYDHSYDQPYDQPYDQAHDPGYAEPGHSYGTAQPYGQPAPGPVYGGGQYAQPAPPPAPYSGGQGGAIYGGGQYSGGQYGEPAAPPPQPPSQPPRRGSTYGRPRPEDEPPTRRGGYGRDNIDM